MRPVFLYLLAVLSLTYLFSCSARPQRVAPAEEVQCAGGVCDAMPWGDIRQVNRAQHYGVYRRVVVKDSGILGWQLSEQGGWTMAGTPPRDGDVVVDGSLLSFGFYSSHLSC